MTAVPKASHSITQTATGLTAPAEQLAPAAPPATRRRSKGA
jgi:hypothetical protein